MLKKGKPGWSTQWDWHRCQALVEEHQDQWIRPPLKEQIDYANELEIGAEAEAASMMYAKWSLAFEVQIHSR